MADLETTSEAHAFGIFMEAHGYAVNMVGRDALLRAWLASRDWWREHNENEATASMERLSAIIPTLGLMPAGLFAQQCIHCGNNNVARDGHAIQCPHHAAQAALAEIRAALGRAGAG